jgi:hypothetical protein
MHLAMSTYTFASYKIARSNSGSSSEEPEEQPEVQEQEVLEADEEVGEDLLECPDHRPSSFERGKPRSVSLQVCKYFINALF